MAKKGRPKSDGPARKTVSFRVLEDLYVECQEAAHHERETLTTVIETHLAKWLQKMRDKHNEGKPFAGD